MASGLFIVIVGLLIVWFGKSIVLMQSEAMERLSGESSWDAGRRATVIIVRIVGGLMILFGLLVATS